MKKHEKTGKSTYHRNLYLFMVFFACFFFVLIFAFFNGKIFAQDEQEVSSDAQQEIYYRNQNPIDLEEILAQNSEADIQEEMCTEEVDLEYTTRYQQDSSLPKDTVQVLQEGRAGTKNVIVIKKYQNGELISEQQVAENIMKAPVDRMVRIGTGNGYSYKISEGDKVYVVAESVAVRLQPNQSTEKIGTLNQKDEAQVLKIEGDWLFVSNIEIKGYVPMNCMTAKNPNQEDLAENAQYSKQQLLSNLSFEMDLRKPSGFSLEQFKQVLSGDKNDKKGVFEQNAEYFYYAEKQYGINGIFVASVGIHESAWGASTIANNKKNLFGYGAVDSNPYGGSYSFGSYAEGIDLISRVFVKYYLNPAGTTIYDGTATSGKFYSGPTLNAVNKRYASDKNWAKCVYKWMEYLYHKL